MSEVKLKNVDNQEVTFRHENGKIIAEIDAPEGFDLEILNKKEQIDQVLGRSCGCDGGFLKALGGFF